MYIYLALSILTTFYAVCSDNAMLQNTHHVDILTSMKEENETISYKDSCIKRCQRNLKRFIASPLEFCFLGLESNDPELLRALLLNYIMQQKLTYQGEQVHDHPGAETLTNMFEENQKSEIAFYVSTKKYMSEECCMACCCCAAAVCSLSQKTVCLPAAITSLLCYASSQQ